MSKTKKKERRGRKPVIQSRLLATINNADQSAMTIQLAIYPLFFPISKFGALVF